MVHNRIVMVVSYLPSFQNFCVQDGCHTPKKPSRGPSNSVSCCFLASSYFYMTQFIVKISIWEPPWGKSPANSDSWQVCCLSTHCTLSYSDHHFLVWFASLPQKENKNKNITNNHKAFVGKINIEIYNKNGYTAWNKVTVRCFLINNHSTNDGW